MIADLVYFVGAFFLLIITPGPGVLSVAGVGSGFGYRIGVRYIAGLWLGTNLVAVAVVSGLAVVLETVPELKLIFLVVSVAFLFYLAARIAFAGTTIAFAQAVKVPGAVDGIFLQFVNPKAYAVNGTLFVSFPLGFESSATEIAVKFLLINIIWVPVHFAWLFLGVSLKRMALAPSTQRLINILMALAMVIVVVLALLSGEGIFD
ncbi:MAG: LysE family translocator [Minwuia sp.]|nr:LysE family translocator [Minwuia sp.]